MFRNLLFSENSRLGTFGDAASTIDALIGVDIEHILALVKAIDWANDNTIGMLAASARFGDDISHF